MKIIAEKREFIDAGRGGDGAGGGDERHRLPKGLGGGEGFEQRGGEIRKVLEGLRWQTFLGQNGSGIEISGSGFLGGFHLSSGIAQSLQSTGQSASGGFGFLSGGRD